MIIEGEILHMLLEKTRYVLRRVSLQRVMNINNLAQHYLNNFIHINIVHAVTSVTCLKHHTFCTNACVDYEHRMGVTCVVKFRML